MNVLYLTRGNNLFAEPLKLRVSLNDGEIVKQDLFGK